MLVQLDLVDDLNHVVENDDLKTIYEFVQYQDEDVRL